MSARPAVVVERAGALTTVQDLGRSGFESAGVPRGGAFDPWAARAANRLVGNADNAALLELTLSGPALRFEAAAVVALVGGDFELRAAGEPRARDETIALAAGSTLEVGRVGSRAAPAPGSRSPAGSTSRRPRQPLDRARRRLRRPRGTPPATRRCLAAFSFNGSFCLRRLVVPIPASEGRDRNVDVMLGLLPGPDESLLGPAGASALATRSWRVSPRSDRRGVRLEGGPLALAESSARRAAMRSIPMLPGAVELTPAGERSCSASTRR